VALKVLPQELAENDERRVRFKREAKSLAALNHPNIVTVYSVEEADGVHFITMELVKGQTLAERLTKSGVSLNVFFDVAVPLADAVAAAFSKSVSRASRPTPLPSGTPSGLQTGTALPTRL
jgi:serine/threonine protein kinase